VQLLPEQAPDFIASAGTAVWAWRPHRGGAVAGADRLGWRVAEWGAGRPASSAMRRAWASPLSRFARARDRRIRRSTVASG